MASRPVRVAIAEAQGLMCAEEVVTEHPLPGFDQAAIDGYAVRSVDVIGVGDGDRESGDVSLPVMGMIEAGARTPSRLQPSRLPVYRRGRRCPPLADAVLPLRWTDGGQNRVRVLRGVRSGPTCVASVTTFSPVMSRCVPGAIIGAAQVGLLAAVGRERCWCIPDPV